MNSRVKKNKSKRLKVNMNKNRTILKKIFKVLLYMLFIVLIIFLTLRYICTYGIIVREYSKKYSTLPKAFNGFKIVQISDIYYGSSIKYNELNKVVNKINEIKPDIVVFTGGLLYKDYNLSEKSKDSIIKLLSKINSTSGKYFVIGQNDNEDVVKILNKSNFKYLQNTSERIYFKSNDYIVLNGIVDDQSFITELDHFNISLIHEPDNIDFSGKTSEIIMSGNSLNGQLRIPFMEGILKFDGSKKYYEPYYKVNSTDLYISGGLGENNYPLRLFNHPSINFYRLRSN